MSDAAKTIEALKTGMETITKKLDDIETKRKDDDASIGAIFRSGAGHTIVGGNSDEKKCLQYFGCSSPLQLLQVNTAAPKFKHVPEELKHLVRELKNAADCARWTSQMFHDQPKDKIGTTAELDRAAHVKGMLDHNYGRNEFAPRLKAFGSTVAGGGDEWVPTIISSQFVEEYQLLRAVEDKFTEMPMASNPYELPTQSGVTKARLIAENTGMTSTNFNTGKITFTAKKLAEYYVMPEELNEDSAVAIYALAKSEVMEAQRRAVEAAILNGDSDGTHIDSDTQAAGADVAEKAWNGLRRQALGNTANGGTTNFSGAVASEALLGQMRSKMKKFGVNPRELVWFLDPIAYQQFLQLDSVTTLEKYGQSATVITGELARYQGIPIIVSEYMRSDLNATGVYDGVNFNKTAALLVNMRRWWIGMRRPIRLKVMEDLANQDRWLLASYQRKDFQGFAQSASEVSVSYGYNILV